MKVMMLSGVVLLSAVSSCAVANATYIESNVRSEISTNLSTPNPRNGSDVDASWWLTNNAPDSYGYNYIGITARVKNGQGDAQPIYQPPLLQTGAAVLKTFTWDNQTPKPAKATLAHRAKVYANLSISLPGPNFPPNAPDARAQLFFDQMPGPVQGTEQGKFTSVARPDGNPATGYTKYEYVANEGKPNYSVTPGQSTRTIGPADSTATVIINAPFTGSPAVENWIRGYVKADARQIAPGKQATAEISGYIYTSLFTLY